MVKVYSKEPRNLGMFDIKCKEMMFVQDMPVAMPGTVVRIPDHLLCFKPLVDAVIFAGRENNSHYIYLSAKRMFVSPTSNYNRPGWHIDGYGSDDLNFLWCDKDPTKFCIQEFNLSTDHAESMIQMTQQARLLNTKTYPVGALLELDNTIVHRVAQVKQAGMRTFAKVSVSRNRYNLEGNAHNYLFDYDWEMVPRSITRNDPAAK